MSPKSRRPVTGRGKARGAPTRTLWSLASPWTTPRRRRGSAGTTSDSYRASVLSTRARRAGSFTWSSAPRIHEARERSHLKSRWASGCSKPASASSISPRSRPRPRSSSGLRGRASASVVPGSQVSIHTSRGVPSGPGTAVEASPPSVGTTRGRGRCGARSARCPSAAHCSSTSPRSRAGCMAFRTKSPAVGGGDAEVVVELAGERPRLGLEAVEASGEENRVRRGQGVGGAALGQHGPDLSPKPAGGREAARRDGGICARLNCLVAVVLALSEYGPPNGGRC